MKISPKIAGALLCIGIAIAVHWWVIAAGQEQVRKTVRQQAIAVGPGSGGPENGRATAAEKDRSRQPLEDAMDDLARRTLIGGILLVGLVAAAGFFLFRRSARLRDGESGPSERERMLASINANLGGTCVYRTIHTPDGRRQCVYVSPNVQALTGLTVEQVLADAGRVFSLVHPEDLPLFRQTMETALVEDTVAEIAVRMRPVHGGEIFVQFQSRPTERRPDGSRVRDGVVFDLTTVQRTEVELRAVRQRLELALRASRTCIWEDDLVANRIRLDSMWAEMRGYPPGETVSTWRSLLAGAHPVDRPAIMAAARRAVLGETDDYQIEQRMRTADGDWIWILSHGRVIERDARGRASRIIGTNTDITVRTRAEAQVKQQADFLAALNETTLDLLNRRDFPDLLRALIERAAVLLDAPNVELLLKEGEELVVHAFTQSVQSKAGLRVSREDAPLSWRAIESGQTVVVDDYATVAHRPNHYDLTRPKGVIELPILRGVERLGVISLARNEANRPFTVEEIRRGEMLARQAALVLHNAAIRSEAVREAEVRTLALRESEERLAFALEATADGLWDWNIATNAVYYSAQWARLLGYAEQEVPPTADFFYAILHAGDRDAVRDAIARHLAGQTPVKLVEVRLRTKAGEYRWFLDRGKVVTRDAAGRPVRMVGTITDVTEQKRHAEEIAHAAASLRATLESTADGILTIGPDHKIATCNRPFREMWHLSAEVLESKEEAEASRLMLGQLADHASFLAKVHYLAAHPEEESSDLLDLKDGRVFERYSRPMLVDGRPAGRVWSFRDITERTRARRRVAAFARLGRELSATDSVTEAAEIIARIADEIFGWDSATLDLYDAASDRCRSVLNIDLIEGQRQSIAPRQVESPPTPRMRRIIARGSELLLREPPLVRTDDTVSFGDVHRLSASLMIVAMRHGPAVVGVLSIQSYKWHAYTADDLDAMQALADHCAGALSRIRAAQALRGSEERLRLVWDSATDGMRLTDGDGQVVAVNEAYCRMMGKVQREIEGRPMSAVYAESERERIFHRYRERFAQRDAAGISEHQVTLWDGRDVLLEVSNCFVETDPARPLMLGVFRDITERRRVEHEREKMQTRLVQNQKLEALGTLAGGVAHDFNNILAGMLNYTALAREDCPETHPTIREYLGEVLKGGHRAKELVRQILLLSRSEAAARAPLQVALVVRETLSLLRSTIPAAVEIVSDIDAQAPSILANATQIHQVIMNLGINAAHAMQARGGTLTVRVGQRRVDTDQAAEIADLEPGPHVWVEVSDTGCGMEPAVAARVFEPFFTTKKVGEGTGLGLAVVRSVVRSHHGALTMRTQPGEGTTFELYFPVPAITAPVAAPAPTNGEFPRGQGQRILVVDDETMVARSMQMVMERLGYAVTVFNRPEEGIARFEAAPTDFDLVITDFQMPGMTGVELAVRVLAARPGTGVFIASGFAGSLTDDQVHDLGIAGMIRKPIEMGELAELLARFFANRS